MGKWLFKRIYFISAIAIIGCWLSPVARETGAAQFRVETENVIIDQAGRRLVAAKPFQRIISLYGAHTENLFNLGVFEEIIGVSRNETYPPEALKKPVFSYHDDPEKFFAARPDLVVIRPMIDQGYPRFVSMLEKNGIKIVSLQPDCVDDMFTYWRILGIYREKILSKLLKNLIIYEREI